MNIGWPEGIMLFFMVMSLGKALAKDGEPKGDKYSFGVAFLDIILTFGLLYWGGFFK